MGLSAYLRLIRFPNVFTAWADILAGLVLIRLGFGTPPRVPLEKWPTVLLLLASSSCLYFGGMALNDVADQNEDFENNPGRPIPAGDIRLKNAAFVAGGLSMLGIVLATLAGMYPVSGEPYNIGPLQIAVILFIAIVFYNFAGKRIAFIGPISMGLCRLFNMQLGMSGDSNFIAYWNWFDVAADMARIAGFVIWIAPLSLMVYIVGITWFSTKEEHGLTKQLAIRGSMWVLAGCMTGVTACMMIARIGKDGYKNWWEVPAWIGWLPLLLLLSVTAYRAAMNRSPAKTKQLVLMGVLGICFFDAGLILGAGGVPYFWEAVIVAFLIIPAAFGGRIMGSKSVIREEA